MTLQITRSPIHGGNVRRTKGEAEIMHYQHIVIGLKESIRLMAESDAAIPAWRVG